MDHQPLVATTDPQLLDAALRWCAAVGATPEVAGDLVAVRRGWRHASAVIVGAELLDDLAEAALSRCDHVLLAVGADQRPWRAALGAGVSGVFELPGDEERIVEALGAALDGRDEACVVSVVGATGGSGASTFVAALALAGARRGLRSLVLDADPLGAGIDLVLGAEHAEGLRWPALDPTRGRVGADTLTEVLPVRDGVSVLSWDRDPAEPRTGVGSLLTAAARGFDLVVADVPRTLDVMGAEVVSRSVLAVLTVPEDVRSVGAARLVLDRLDRCCSGVVVVSVARPGGLGAHGVADVLGRPVVARIRRDRRLAAAIEHGHGPGRSRSLRRSADAVLDALGLVDDD